LALHLVFQAVVSAAAKAPAFLVLALVACFWLDFDPTGKKDFQLFT